MGDPATPAQDDPAKDLAGELTELLSGRGSAELRTATAAAVAAYSSSRSEASKLIPPHGALAASATALLRALWRVSGEGGAKGAGRYALSALLNFAEDPRVALLLGELGVVRGAMEAVVDRGHRLTALYAGLLANVSREAAVAERAVAAQEVRGFVEVVKALRLLPDTAVMFVGNVAMVAGGRDVLCEGGGRLLKDSGVMEMVGRGVETKRLAAVGLLRNLAKDSSRIGTLLEIGVLDTLIVRLVDGKRARVALEEMQGAGRMIEDAVKDKEKTAEEVKEIRMEVCEALLLFCQTREGRDGLRQRKAYPIVKSWHLAEEEETIKDLLVGIVARTELLEEEDVLVKQFGSA